MTWRIRELDIAIRSKVSSLRPNRPIQKPATDCFDTWHVAPVAQQDRKRLLVEAHEARRDAHAGPLFALATTLPPH